MLNFICTITIPRAFCCQVCRARLESKEHVDQQVFQAVLVNVAKTAHQAHPVSQAVLVSKVNAACKVPPVSRENEDPQDLQDPPDQPDQQVFIHVLYHYRKISGIAT